MIAYLLMGITFAFAAAVQPGPLFTFIVSKALSHGWKSTLPAAFAPLLSDGPIFLLVIFVLSNVSAGFIHVIQFAGGLFLLYLAYKAYKAWQLYNPDKIIDKQSGRQTIINAAMVNILNPNPYIGWSLVMGPLFLTGWNESSVKGLALIFGFYCTIIITMMGIIILFSAARRFGPKISRVLIGISAAALFLFGVYELYLAMEYFIE
ncbi:MAG: LysE family transporter [Calditrichaceae bacterium]|nr:LysE family transporter [Calditrichaceae bacterium]MBN2708540.1 LysE family transporter [Calditrichaceae bacterium]RQV93495.1 MAG: hypothetical protein EH224_12420 [Calditrichota bacterium]